MSNQPVRNAAGQFYRTLSIMEVNALPTPAFRDYQLWLADQESRRRWSCEACGSQVEFPGLLHCNWCQKQLANQQALVKAAKDAVTSGLSICRHHPDGTIEHVAQVEIHKQPAHDPIMHLIERYESEIRDRWEGTDRLEAKLAPARAAREHLARSVPGSRKEVQP